MTAVSTAARAVQYPARAWDEQRQAAYCEVRRALGQLCAVGPVWAIIDAPAIERISARLAALDARELTRADVLEDLLPSLTTANAPSVVRQGIANLVLRSGLLTTEELCAQPSAELRMAAVLAIGQEG